jgi:transposase-like protein
MVKDGKVETECYCLSCKDETLHVLNYVEGYLKSGQCKSCGKEFQNKKTLLKAYLMELAERIAAKPEEVLIEIENKGIKKFLSDAPHRLSEKYKEELTRIYNLLK